MRYKKDVLNYLITVIYLDVGFIYLLTVAVDHVMSQARRSALRSPDDWTEIQVGSHHSQGHAEYQH